MTDNGAMSREQAIDILTYAPMARNPNPALISAFGGDYYAVRCTECDPGKNVGFESVITALDTLGITHRPGGTLLIPEANIPEEIQSVLSPRQI